MESKTQNNSNTNDIDDVKDELTEEDGFYDNDKSFIFSVLDRDHKRFIEMGDRNRILEIKKIQDYIDTKSHIDLSWYKTYDKKTKKNNQKDHLCCTLSFCDSSKKSKIIEVRNIFGRRIGTIGVIIDRESYKNIVDFHFYDLNQDQVDSKKEPLKDLTGKIKNYKDFCKSILNILNNDNNDKKNEQKILSDVKDIFEKFNVKISELSYNKEKNQLSYKIDNKLSYLFANNDYIVNNEIILKNNNIKISNLIINLHKGLNRFVLAQLDNIIETQHKIGHNYIIYKDDDNSLHKVSFEKFIEKMEYEFKTYSYSGDETIISDKIQSCKNIVYQYKKEAIKTLYETINRKAKQLFTDTIQEEREVPNWCCGMKTEIFERKVFNENDAFIWQDQFIKKNGTKILEDDTSLKAINNFTKKIENLTSKNVDDIPEL